MASGILSVATQNAFIGLPVSIPLGTVSQAGVSVSGVATALTTNYQKKLMKVTKLVNIMTSALAVFETSISKALNDGGVDEWEFAALQMFHLEALNKLANIDCKMESEMRALLQKVYWKSSTISRSL